MMLIKRRYHLRKSAVRELTDELESKFGSPVRELLKGSIEVAELEGDIQVVLSNGEPIMLKSSEGIFPTLVSAVSLPLKRVTVDMGAVGPVTSGADVMAPGIVWADEEIARGDIVVVVDERHEKPLAIGLALVDGSSLKGSKGKVVKNLHYIGDKLWGIAKRALGKG